MGEGPFPTLLPPEEDQKMREIGKEFGATTGRPRRCGWFDSVLVRHSVMINGISELAIMKLDVLDELKELKICTAYEYKGKRYEDFPMDFEILSKAKPVYEDMPGWVSPTRGATEYAKLPLNARCYIERLEKLLNVSIRYVSTGSKRHETIIRY